MIYQLWVSDDGTESTFATKEAFDQDKKLALTVDGEQMNLVWSAEADSWEEISKMYDEYRGN
jgi:hypothetical protein